MDSTAKVKAEPHISAQTTCVILFAKYPARDKAKTRLQPALGVDGAADMAIAIADHCYGCTAGQGSSCGGALEEEAV